MTTVFIEPIEEYGEVDQALVNLLFTRVSAFPVTARIRSVTSPRGGGDWVKKLYQDAIPSVATDTMARQDATLGGKDATSGPN